jgi:hypothetical protein
MQTESKSGGGSTLKQTETIRRELPLLFDTLHIKSILDVPCGDFNWMKEVELGDREYIGCDIVPSVIEENIEKYTDNHRSFMILDLITDFLPQCDLILCRDCLVHFPVDMIKEAIKNMKASGAIYLLTTSFTGQRINQLDMPMGHWQPLNLLGYPFNFPRPMQVINEKCTEGNGDYADKSLLLWKLSDLVIDD